jgi:hypothetical protein
MFCWKKILSADNSGPLLQQCGVFQWKSTIKMKKIVGLGLSATLPGLSTVK